MIHSHRVLGRRAARRGTKPKSRSSVRGVEAMEPRWLLSLQPVFVGTVFVEEDAGNDAHGDRFYVTFEGGAPGTQLERLVIDGDQNAAGFNVGDVFFDTNDDNSEPGSGRFGADGAFDIQIVSHEGIDSVTPVYRDGSSLVEFYFEGFEAGERLEFTVDVDEVEDYDPSITDTQRINDGFDPITSGVEFQGSLLAADLTAPDFEPATAQSTFVNRYDPILADTGLNLPPDDDRGLHDRTAGAVARVLQTAMPATISGHVYHDQDMDGERDSNESGIGDATMQAIPVATVLDQAIRTATTDAQGRYEFTNLMPGTYRIVQAEQPDGYLDWVDQAGTVDGIVTGTAVNPGDAIDDVSLPGGSVGRDYDFAELLPVSIDGRVQLATPDGDCFSDDVFHPPVANSLVELLDTAGNVVAQTRTNADGRYQFTDLAPGTYTVRQHTPDGLIDGEARAGIVEGQSRGEVTGSSQVSRITLSSGETIRRVDFCELEPVSIRGRVQLANVNGDCFDEDQFHAPLAGVTVRLADESGSFVAETTTGSDGRYAFTDLDPGVYSVFEVTPENLFEGGARAGHVSGDIRGRIDGANWIRQIQLGSGETLVDADFCEKEPVSIQGRVQLSNVDGDCFSESVDHAPVQGARVQLRDESGQTVAQTTTDADGRYEFFGLRPGVYSVFELTPEGLIDGGARAGWIDGIVDATARVVDAGLISNIVLGPGQEAERFDFCENMPSSLSGFVYHDRDGNGQRGTGARVVEPGIADVTVQLVDDSGQSVAETTTDAEGRYQFEQLPAGSYQLVEVQPSGWLDGIDAAGTVDGLATGQADNPGDRIREIDIGWGQIGQDYHFGELQAGAIFGDVHLSTVDGDCFGEDRDHTGLTGVMVQLLNQDGAVVDTTRTDSLGQYAFLDLAPGQYGLRQTVPDGLFVGGAQPGSTTWTVDGSASVDSDSSFAEQVGRVVDATTVIDIDLRSGETVTDVAFCNHQPSELSGKVFHDQNSDHRRGPQESGIAGVLLRLLNRVGQEVARTRTDRQGAYRFEDLEAGEYQIVEQQPSGWLDGWDSPGTVDGVPMGAASNPGDSIHAIHLGWGQSGSDYDFGELLPARLAGVVHTDLNADCIQQTNERPIVGVEIQLLDDRGQVVATQETDADGRFVFMNVLPGTYELREVTPEAFPYFQGGQRAGTGGGDASVTDRISQIEIHSGDVLYDYAFCEEPASEISGFVFQDGPPIRLEEGEQLPEDLTLLRDGQRTPDDQPLAGVVLQLRSGIDGRPITSDMALPGTYPEGPIETVTDANGFYQFKGLRKGNYAVYQIQPEGYIDSIDTGGTIPAIAINRHTVDDIAPQILSSLTTDPNFDAIVRIALPPGQRSLHNNFSEIVTERPLIIPFDNPPPAPIPPAYTIQLEPSTIPPQRDLSPLPYQPSDYGRGAGVMATTWHLSIIDGGWPRGEGVTVPAQGPFWMTSAYEYQLAWHGSAANQLAWEILVDGRVDRQLIFGMASAVGVAGDFNGDGMSEVGVFHEGQWFIDLNGNGRWDDADLWAKLGYRGDQPVVGDWDGDGKDDIGVFGRALPGDPGAIQRDPGLPDLQNPKSGQRKNMPPNSNDETVGRRHLRVTADGRTRSDVVDHVFHYGTFGDIAVAGDWNGDGIGNIGIFNKGMWHLDTDGDGRFTDADRELQYGKVGDRPIVGDFNGDGVDEVGILRNGRLVLDINRNYRIDSGDQVLNLQGIHLETDDRSNRPLHQVIVGDWNGDGTDDIAITRTGKDEGRQSTLRFVEVDARQ